MKGAENRVIKGSIPHSLRLCVFASRTSACVSVDGNARGLGDFGPLLRFALDECGELIGRHA